MRSKAEKLEKEFLAFYEKYADAIFRHCYFRIYDRERAQDLVQETFMRTWNEIVQGRAIKNIRAFLYRVATNLIIDEHRKKRLFSLDAIQEAGVPLPPAPRENIDARIDAEQIVEQLEKLDEPYREVLVMRFVDDLKPREIAKILDVSTNVISVRIHRGLRQFRNILQHNE